MTDSEEEEVAPLLNERRSRLKRRQTSIIYERAREKLILKSDRTIIVEPLMALAGVATAPFLQLYQEYILFRTLEDLAEDNGINMNSSALSSKSNCLQPQNGSSVNQTVSSITESSQATTAVFIIFLNLATAIPACVMTPLITAYSDNMGRRYAIVPPMIGLTFKTLIYLLVVAFKWPLYWLLVANFLNGVTGDHSILTASCTAYVSDVTTRNKRSFRIAVLLSCTTIPMIIFPLLFGFMVETVGFIYPFLCVFVFQAIGLLYSLCCVPETIARLQSVPFWSWTQVKATLSVFTKQREPEGRRGQICVILLSTTLCVIFLNGGMELIALFQMNTPLCWDPQMIGIYMATSMVIAVLGQAISVRVMKYFLPELVICLISTCFLVLMSAYTGFVRNTTMMFLGAIFMPVAMISIPMTRSMLSSLILPEEQGKLHGGIAFLERIGNLFSSMFFYAIYAWTLKISSGFVFFVVAGMNMINVVLLLVFIIYLKVKNVDFRFLIVNRRLSTRQPSLTQSQGRTPSRVSFDSDQ